MKRSYLLLALGLGLSLALAGCTSSDDQDQADTTAPSPTPTEAVAAPTVKAASISGILNIEGAVVQNTTALMLQRKAGEATYKEFDRMPAADGLEWSFDQAVSGVTYEITAALQVDENNKATGNVVTAVAPASGEALHVSTTLNLPAPAAVPSVVCGDADNTGGYNATISYQRIKGAEGYYYQVGSEAGKDDVDKGYTINPENPSSYPFNNVYVKSNTDYFTRYAYTECTDCNVHDKQNWSGWSPTLGFACPAK